MFLTKSASATEKIDSQPETPSKGLKCYDFQGLGLNLKTRQKQTGWTSGDASRLRIWMSPPIDLVEWGPQTPNCWKLCVRAHTLLTHNHHNIPIKPCKRCRNVTSGPALHELQGVTRNELCNFHVSLPPKVICSFKHHRATAMPRMNSQLQGTSVCTGTLGDGHWGNLGFSTRFDFFFVALALGTPLTQNLILNGFGAIGCKNLGRPRADPTIQRPAPLLALWYLVPAQANLTTPQNGPIREPIRENGVFFLIRGVFFVGFVNSPCFSRENIPNSEKYPIVFANWLANWPMVGLVSLGGLQITYLLSGKIFRLAWQRAILQVHLSCLNCMLPVQRSRNFPHPVSSWPVTHNKAPWKSLSCQA